MYFSVIRLAVSFSKTKHKKLDKSTSRNIKRTSGRHPVFKTLLTLSVMLTATKLIVSLLHSAEAIFIPAALQKFGCSPSDALSIYGILSGMALPFILFHLP